MLDCTVVIVSYEHAPFVTQCLDSIASQSRQPSRVVMIDNASSDSTVELARQWKRENSFPLEIRALHENRGICPRLNEALDELRTPLYTYISTDDMMMPERIEKQVDALERADSDVAMIYSDAYLMGTSGELWPELASEKVPVPENFETDTFLALLRDNWIPTPSAMMRTESVREIGGYDPSLRFEDYDLWLRLAKRNSFMRIDEPLVAARQVADTSLTARLMGDSAGWQMTTFRLYLKHLNTSEAANAVIRPKLDRLVRPLAMLPKNYGAAPLLRAYAARRPAFRSAAAAVLATTGIGSILR